MKWFYILTACFLGLYLHMLNAFVNPDGELWAYDPMACSYPGGGIAKILKISFGYPVEASF